MNIKDHPQISGESVESLLDADLYEACFINGRQRATVAFCNMLCAKYGIDMEWMYAFIEQWNHDNAPLPGDDSDDLADRLFASLQTGCSQIELEDRYDEFGFVALLTIVRARKANSLKSRPKTARVKKIKFDHRGNS
jgi:hypothetical protein